MSSLWWIPFPRQVLFKVNLTLFSNCKRHFETDHACTIDIFDLVDTSVAVKRDPEILNFFILFVDEWSYVSLVEAYWLFTIHECYDYVVKVFTAHIWKL